MQIYWICFILGLLFSNSSGYLYPIESESRQVKNLNGLWLFHVDSSGIGFTNKWYDKDFKCIADYMFMPVPGSFNEIFPTFFELNEYLGWVWYQREFYLGKKWSGSKIFVYFGAVDHTARVWCNGVFVGRHRGGHIPFHVEITQAINWDGRNVLTVSVNNTLTPETIPQGYVTYPNDTGKYPPGTHIYTHSFDYFDYAGINRNVFLYSVPQVFIKDLNVIADSVPNFLLKYEIIASDNSAPYDCSIKLTDECGNSIVSHRGCNESVPIKIRGNSSSALGWLPGAGVVCYLQVTMTSGRSKDIYRTLVGFRTLDWEGGELKINGNKLYLRGFGMHEDADIRGRGYDDVMMYRDIGLVLWTGANIIRTSHYPYSEEFLIQCDIWGISVILEVPACSLEGFSESLYREHERTTLEIIASYKHHPSIIMWSLANEPASDNNASTAYFSRLYSAAKAADSTRPITFVTSRSPDNDLAIGDMDLVLLNRYSGWYQNGGRLDLVSYQVIEEITTWHKKYNKPIIVTEYGAGTIPGQNSMSSSMWTEDYQTQLFERHFKAFDHLRNAGILAGEMIWNLIDFKTPQEYFRPGYCMKGIFTRQRDPKPSAFIVRKRYNTLPSTN